jgi:ribosomal protein S6E (S10)
MDATELNKISLEIQVNAFKFIQDSVKEQIAAGLPDRGMPMKRHLALVAQVTVEMLASYPKPEKYDKDETTWQRWVLQQVYAGSMLNASALRQDLEGKGKREVILQKETALANDYGV